MTPSAMLKLPAGSEVFGVTVVGREDGLCVFTFGGLLDVSITFILGKTNRIEVGAVGGTSRYLRERSFGDDLVGGRLQASAILLKIPEYR